MGPDETPTPGVHRDSIVNVPAKPLKPLSSQLTFGTAEVSNDFDT